MSSLFAVFSADTLLTIGLNLVLVLPVIAVAALIARKPPSPGWTLLAFLFLALNTLLVFAPLGRIMPEWYHHLHFNWGGKLLSLAFTIAFIAAVPKVGFKDCGFTWKQAGVVPAVICGGLICALLWGASVIHAGGLHLAHPGLESLLYEATIPGLHEEPAYRGVALLLFDRAFSDKRWMLFGAPMGWGAIATTVFFGIGHGMGFDHGQFMVDWLAVGLTGAVGFLLAWMRARTGSLVLPVVFHNLVNVGNHFIG